MNSFELIFSQLLIKYYKEHLISLNVNGVN
jgi:hypothetical protein